MPNKWMPNEGSGKHTQLVTQINPKDSKRSNTKKSNNPSEAWAPEEKPVINNIRGISGCLRSQLGDKARWIKFSS